MGSQKTLGLSFPTLVSTGLNEVLGWEREAAAADGEAQQSYSGKYSSEMLPQFNEIFFYKYFYSI